MIRVGQEERQQIDAGRTAPPEDPGRLDANRRQSDANSVKHRRQQRGGDDTGNGREAHHAPSIVASVRCQRGARPRRYEVRPASSTSMACRLRTETDSRAAKSDLPADDKGPDQGRRAQDEHVERPAHGHSAARSRTAVNR